MPFRFTDRALALARENGGILRVEIVPGPQYAKPLLLDVFHEEGARADHVAFPSAGVTVLVPAHLTWLADNEVQIDAAADGHLHGAIGAVRRPW
ncbi:MAG: hypothetical protein HUU15_11830 [Candidatus Brocadiae bacterium]|nr:hypothetical protein [Candidatus Brocadiia bacterium]